MSQTQRVIACCNSGSPIYDVTYDTNPQTQMDVCGSCWKKEEQIQVDESTTKKFKILQLRASKTICKTCHSDVTDTMGCNACHPREEIPQ